MAEADWQRKTPAAAERSEAPPWPPACTQVLIDSMCNFVQTTLICEHVSSREQHFTTSCALDWCLSAHLVKVCTLQLDNGYFKVGRMQPGRK